MDFAICAYARDGGSVRMRMLPRSTTSPKDPATGSAAAALGAMLAKRDGAPLTLHIAQGVEMGRPSAITVEAAPPDAAGESAVAVSGRAVRVMEGRLILQSK